MVYLTREGMARSSHHGCCTALHLREDNARFILLALVMVVYMVTGATVFMVLEQDNEAVEKDKYAKYIKAFKDTYPNVNETDLDDLLRVHASAHSLGYVGYKRPRWDFSGSFYFVGTVVSTIGKWSMSVKIHWCSSTSFVR